MMPARRDPDCACRSENEMMKNSTTELRVLEVVRPPDGTTRYVDQVISHPDPGISFAYISWKRFVRFDFDVVHLHWPEMVVRSGNPVVERLKCIVFDTWISVLRRRGIAIVRTLHNLHPHDGASGPVRRLLRRLEDRTDVRVTINPTTVVEGEHVYIPHGHYRDRFAHHRKPPVVPGRVLYAGLIRPYKGVDDLLTAFASADETATLRLVGKPTPELRALVERAVDDSASRISARLEFVPDEDFVEEIAQAELVCLPYRELHNSGILLVALSLDRPVLVPDTPATRALSEEVGPGWVIRYSGTLQPEHLDRAREAVRSTPADARPSLADRDWVNVGQRYSAAFRRARTLASARG
jgi:beta-1,4-mannosyltransferase